MLPVIAVDFGGTHIRTALFPTENPQPSRQLKKKTQATRGPEYVIEQMVEAIEELTPSDVESLRIGIASPGTLDEKKEIVLVAANLPGWENYPLKQELSSKIDAHLVIENDSKLAALGEYVYGAGQHADPLMYLTLGTGIGGALIIKGELLQGVHGLASEFGHMTVDPNGPICSCGKRGHLEAIASGPAITRAAITRIKAGEESILAATLQAGEILDAEIISHAASRGDHLAMDVISDAGKAIGIHLASLVHAINPARIVVGGGMARMGLMLFTPMRHTLLDEIIHPAYNQDLEIRPAQFGDNSGLIGAMLLARKH